MESKRTLLNNILRIVSNGEKLNKELKEAVFAVKADSLATLATLNAFVTTQKTLVAMLRELINEVKKLHTPPVQIEEMSRLQAEKKPQPLPLTPSMNNDVVKPRRISTREKDLFSQTKQHYDYTDTEKTIGQAKAVKTLLAEGYNLSNRPFLALHSLVRKLGIPVLPTKAKNAKSGNYRLYVKDLKKVREYLR